MWTLFTLLTKAYSQCLYQEKFFVIQQNGGQVHKVCKWDNPVHFLACNFAKCSPFYKYFSPKTNPFYSRLDFVRDYPGELVSNRWNQKGKTKLDLLEQETMSGSGISWAKCKSAPHSRQITTPASHHLVFTGQIPFLPPNQQHQSTTSAVSECYWFLTSVFRKVV